MEREVFASRLHAAAIQTRVFAQTFVREPLPQSLLFRVRLGCSFDGNPLVGDERTYSSDQSMGRAHALQACDEARVVDALWRDGRVPEWVDAAVVGITRGAALIELRCCGRFTARDEFLYHREQGCAPFHVLGTALPPDYVAGETFTIYRRLDCWTLDDLESVQRHPGEIESLQLVGREFNDDMVMRLPEMPRLQRLALRDVSVVGRSVASMLRFPALRSLSFTCPENFRLPMLSADFPALEEVEVLAPPRRPWGFDAFIARAPRLHHLTLAGTGRTFIGAALPERVRALHITAQRLPEQLELPKALSRLSLTLPEEEDAPLRRWLASLKRVDDLSLRGTPVNDALAEHLADRLGLLTLDVVDTRVSSDALRRIKRRRPALRTWPSLEH